jgi:hypothetical protein
MTHMLQRRATRYFLILFLLCNSFINIGCTTEKNRESYRPEEVQTRIVSDDVAKKIYVIFRTNMESQFYSPGVRTSTDGENTITINFIRAEIQDKLIQVDIKAPYLVQWIKDNKIPQSLAEKIKDQSTSADQVFILSNNITEIYISGDARKALIWKKN